MLEGKRLAVALGGLGATILLGLGASYAIGGEQSRTDQVRAQLRGGEAKNVIFFLGDGMGTQEITAARYYQYGAAGRMNVDRLPFTGFQTTWSVKPGTAPLLPDYDPDSASTGTMWATGQKTIDERISQGPSTALNVPGKNLTTVLEKAQRAGKATGNVSTAEITDATPAVLNSHISIRGCQGPQDTVTTCPQETKAAGGLGSIAEQTVDHHVDVVLGGGRNRFTQTIAGGPDAGKTVEQSAARQGYTEITTADQLAAARASDKPLLGLFTGGTMTTEWNGPVATLGDGTPAQKCVTTNRPANEPSLTDMTRKAIQLLDSPRNRKGFFLQVEGASIDKQDHAANACAQIGETVAFDNAIGVALDYQRTHPDTLIVVTADHAHTSQIVGEDTSGTGNPTGYSNNLTTKDGQTMRVTYGTAGGDDAPGGEHAEPAAHRLRGPDLGRRPGRRRDPRHDRPHRPVRRAPGQGRPPLVGPLNDGLRAGGRTRRPGLPEQPGIGRVRVARVHGLAHVVHDDVARPREQLPDPLAVAAVVRGAVVLAQGRVVRPRPEQDVLARRAGRQHAEAHEPRLAGAAVRQVVQRGARLGVAPDQRVHLGDEQQPGIRHQRTAASIRSTEPGSSTCSIAIVAAPITPACSPSSDGTIRSERVPSGTERW